MKILKFLLTAVLAATMAAPASLALADNWTLQGNNLYSNNSGNLGVGTQSPTQKLEVDGGFLVQNPGGGGGSPNGYSYSRSITINHAQVSNTDQTNFPTLVSLSDPSLKTVANGGHVQSSSGYDIIFAADAAGSAPLSWEMEKYDGSAGIVLAWVKIPLLSQAVDTVFYMFYGNGNISSLQSNPSAVWDSNYVAVYHFSNTNGSLNLNDSTANGNNLTNHSATSTAGKIDGGAAGTNSGTYAYNSSPVGLPTGSAPRTVEAWFSTVNTSAGDQELFGYGGNSANGSRYMLDVIASLHQVRIEAQNKGTGFGNWTPDTSLHMAVATMATSTNLFTNMYIDGSFAGNGASDNASTTAAEIALFTIPQAHGNGPLIGTADEARISNIARSADWIKTEYNNQSNPSTFYTLGLEQQASGSGSPSFPLLLVTPSGKIGIGTTTPTQALDVNGNVKLSGSILSDGDICIGACQ